MVGLEKEITRYGDGRFRRVFDHAPVGMAVIDQDRRLRQVNRALCLGLGYTELELLSRKLDEFFHPDDRAQIRKFTTQLFRGDIPSFGVEERFVRKDGRPFWLDLAGFLVEADSTHESFVLVLAEDITPRKEAESALRTSEERYRSFVVNSSEAIWRFELEQPMSVTLPVYAQVDWFYQHAYLAECNDALARLCDHERAEDLIGVRVDRVFPANLENLAAIRALVSNQYRVHNSPSVMPDRPGGERYLSSTIFGVVANGYLLRLWGTQRDETRRTVAENSLKHSHEQLRSLVARLQSLREIECANLARELHDVLGQSLTGLKLELARIQKHLPAADNESANGLASAFAQIEHAIAQVKVLATELRPAVLDQFGLVAAIEWQCQEFTQRTALRCASTFPEQALELPAEYATALFRILQESLANVARHAHATQVWITLYCDDSEVILSVKDNGRGITENEISAADSLGLLGMRERAETLGGRFLIEGRSGRTLINVRLLLV